MVKNLCKNLSFNTLTQKLIVNGNEIKLTTKESQLFDFLSDNVNTISKREDVLLKIWKNNDYFNSRSMDVYITKLRKHLKPIENVSIINVHGEGHRLVISTK
ncbi:winged helix family transcriptional regulator [Dysgonomonas sp. 216]|uniref:winged helix-turn-helix domain-containing protein n=1 Tax=Dysgonomonas sp. 216 TaxID=2302934 RepID=UPI0013D09612|nr:winged helix-turn-helix domain-containing protein [Dysgonomonas sp. 216]NDW19435.1 winged helix family transcriptional regulator [Dysgonomonas sp. 216]